MLSFFNYNLYSQCCKTDPAEIRGTWQAVEAVIFVLPPHHFIPKPADLHLRLRRESRATRVFSMIHCRCRKNSWLSFRLLPAAWNTKSLSAPRVLRPAWWMLNIIITRLEGHRRSGLVSAVSQVDLNRRTGVCFYWTVQPYLVHWPVSVNAYVSTSGVNREAYLKRRFQFRYTQCIKQTICLFIWQSQT